MRTTTSLSTADSEIDRHLQVSGLETFTQNRWREAILYYLFGVWGNLDKVMYRPKIYMGGLALRLDPRAESYYAYGKGCSRERDIPVVKPEARLIASHSQFEVEGALIRFVKNNAIRVLEIQLESGGRVWIWKTSRRGEYRTACDDMVPDSMEAFMRS